MKKLAIVSPWAIDESSVGGTERFVIDLAETLQARGIAVTVLMFSGDDWSLNGIDYVSLDLFEGRGKASEYDLMDSLSFEAGKDYRAFATRVEERAELGGFDAVIINSLLLLNAWVGRRRLFVIHTNPYEFEQDWEKTGYETMLKILSVEGRDPDAIFVAPSAHYCDLYTEKSGTKVEYVPHAIDRSRLLTAASKQELLGKYHLDTTASTILVPGRLEPLQKRPALVLEALSSLPTDRHDYQVLFTGLDPQYQKEAEHLRRLAETKNIRIAIHRFKDMAEAYAACDIVVLPSRSESFGYTALESLSLGIPTVLNSIPSYREIGTGADNAYFFEDSAGSLAKILMGLPKDLQRKLQAPEWQRRYSRRPWADRYIRLLQIL